jgi:hypothetical protein
LSRTRRELKGSSIQWKLKGDAVIFVNQYLSVVRQKNN